MLGAGVAGIDAAEASAKLERFGPNVLAPTTSTSLVVKFLVRFRNPLVLILIVASAISAFTGDVASFVIISTIVLMSVVLDSVQEQRARSAAERLRRSVALKERVLRDGAEREIEAAEIVPGDLVLLSAGDLVPADGRLVEAKDFFVNEALLTGEAYPGGEAGIRSPAGQADLAGATNAVFMGSSVVSGTAKLLVAVTGAATQLGSHRRQPEAPAAADRLCRRHPRFRHADRPPHRAARAVRAADQSAVPPAHARSFLFAMALAVGLTPELLPMIVSVTLARGAVRMAQRAGDREAPRRHPRPRQHGRAVHATRPGR